jgi:hypothetical protein
MEKDADIAARRPRAAALPTTLQIAALLPCIALLAACQGKDDLSASGCLPLRAPAQVVLVQEAGLYTVRDAKTLVL